MASINPFDTSNRIDKSEIPKYCSRETLHFEWDRRRRFDYLAFHLTMICLQSNEKSIKRKQFNGLKNVDFEINLNCSMDIYWIPFNSYRTNHTVWNVHFQEYNYQNRVDFKKDKKFREDTKLANRWLYAEMNGNKVSENIEDIIRTRIYGKYQVSRFDFLCLAEYEIFHIYTVICRSFMHSFPFFAMLAGTFKKIYFGVIGIGQ